MKKLLILTFMLFAFAAGSYAQATASATGTATIVAPIGITKTVDMNFGNIAVSGAGTVILAAAGTRTATGGITLPAITGTVAAASFDVTGSDGYTYTITLPSTDYTITRVSGTETMIINTFTSDPSGTGTLTGGTETVNVGATLNVNAGQVGGTYTNATGFDVTVNYN